MTQGSRIEGRDQSEVYVLHRNWYAVDSYIELKLNIKKPWILFSELEKTDRYTNNCNKLLSADQLSQHRTDMYMIIMFLQCIHRNYINMQLRLSITQRRLIA